MGYRRTRGLKHKVENKIEKMPSRKYGLYGSLYAPVASIQATSLIVLSNVCLTGRSLFDLRYFYFLFPYHVVCISHTTFRALDL